MSDLRLILAEEICEQIGAELYPGRCDCGWPLMEFRDQRVPCCWFCTTDRVNAERGQNLLERLKRGITITHIGNDAFVEERGQAA